MKWFYMSFAAPGVGNLGVCIVQADNFLAAVRRSIALGVNPGGEVVGQELEIDGDPDSHLVNRLMQADEVLALTKLNDKTPFGARRHKSSELNVKCMGCGAEESSLPRPEVN